MVSVEKQHLKAKSQWLLSQVDYWTKELELAQERLMALEGDEINGVLVRSLRMYVSRVEKQIQHLDREYREVLAELRCFR